MSNMWEEGTCSIRLHSQGKLLIPGYLSSSVLTAMTAQGQNMSEFDPSGQGQNLHGFDQPEFWIGDTGATHHMTGDMNQLVNLLHLTVDTSAKITIGNGTGHSITHIGSVLIPSSQSNPSMRLSNVLFAPKSKANLLSFNKLGKDNKCYVTLDDTEFCVQAKKTKVVIFQGKSNNSLYLFPALSANKSISASSALLGQAVKCSLWHKRLGHPSDPTNEVSCIISLVLIHLNRMVAHAAILINRMPCKALDMKSPFQKLFSKPPDLSYLRVFGTACHPYLGPYCKNKLEPRHVIFDESVFPYKSVITSNKSSGQKTLLSTASSSARSATQRQRLTYSLSPNSVAVPSLPTDSPSHDSSSHITSVSTAPSFHVLNNNQFEVLPSFNELHQHSDDTSSPASVFPEVNPIDLALNDLEPGF
ncbi:hypothetical protein ACLB2K_034478 [Fragaria x ananassa]